MFYAMGGGPQTAMNIVCFPLKQMEFQSFGPLKWWVGQDVRTRRCLVGGHSVGRQGTEIRFSVTGFIHPDRILTKKIGGGRQIDSNQADWHRNYQ
jgi:selenide,water dikinase